MSGVFLTGAFEDPDGDLPTSDNVQSQILGLSDLQSWHQADASSIVYGTPPAIASFTCKKGSGRSFAQVSAGQQAPLVAAQINGFPGAVFNGSTDWYLINSGHEIDPTNNFTFALMLVPSASGGSQVLLAKNGTKGMYVQLQASGLSFTNGGGQCSIPGNFITGQPLLVIGSYSKSRQVVRLRANGVNSSAVSATATQSGGSTALGAFNASNPQALWYNGGFSDVLLFGGTTGDVGDLFNEPNELALVEDYMVTTYGLPFAPFGT